ncbi:hypothetical protein PIB30_034595 [Stylosanthes scabra]|uniref:DUF4283 domain-containing protein n=1 Tax=Stylosanthes scabra TaxID=79078 RepID=A0ABU6VBI3_9FABA|nr:hypothetical protein [Stylosanthes scabra]
MGCFTRRTRLSLVVQRFCSSCSAMKGGLKVENQVISRYPVWIQFWGMPENFKTLEVASKLGASIDKVLEGVMRSWRNLCGTKRQAEADPTLSFEQGEGSMVEGFDMVMVEGASLSMQPQAP